MEPPIILFFSQTGPPYILKIESMGPLLTSKENFNGAQGYFDALTFGVMHYIQSLYEKLMVEVQMANM